MLKEVLKKAAESAGIKLLPYEWPVIIRNGVNQNGEKLHYVLYYLTNALVAVAKEKRYTFYTGVV